MSIQGAGWALDQDIPARPKLVLVAIANHADHRTGYCWLKADTISEEASCSPRAVFNFIGDLIRNGYIRKAPRRSDDGKQRANDYWIIFDRSPAEWISDRTQAAAGEDDGASAEAEETAVDDAISSEPHARRRAHGETAPEPPAEAPEMSPGAVGPHAPACSRKSLAEPSKIKPTKKEKEGAHPLAAVPRKYHAPPLVQGALHPDASKPIFVYQGTPAWDAWMAHKLATSGVRWTLTKTVFIDGAKRSGWWFPTLFPPRRETKAESGEEESATGPPLQ